ncbi:MAG: 3-methyl-2-oxobutanoate hydroxymethyltransferase [Fibrobacterota bacterium]
MKNLNYPATRTAMLTAYDYPGARYAEKAGIDCILVGDSLGTNILGYETVRDVTIEDMLHHTRAVRRGALHTYIIADLPFQSLYSPDLCLRDAEMLLDCGADAVKIEVEDNKEEHLKLLRAKNIPFCGHIGFTPQTAWLTPSLQGATPERAKELYRFARQVEYYGGEYLILELLPANLAEFITEHSTVPTIGIGSGPHCAGEVQVCLDICGISEKIYRHSHLFAPAGDEIQRAYTRYVRDVKNGNFPTQSNSRTVPQDIIEYVKESEAQ